MDDEHVRRRLSEGDFAVLGNLDLTDEERALVKDAAGDYPEVAGFSFQAFQASVVGESKDHKYKIDFLAYQKWNKFALAYKYVQRPR
jgi:hypothetical protein